MGFAQAPPRFQVSPSSAVTAGSLVVAESAIVSVGGGGAPVAHFMEGHWQATAGFVPGDVDGFARRPFTTPGSAESFAFSTLSNEGMFLDGDILGLAVGGGVEVIVPEADIATALGVPLANIDIDAFDFDEQGGLFFSLQSDLTGTGLGTVLDGDIVYLDSLGRASLFLTEADVQAKFTAATGLASAIGEVTGIEHISGEVWVTVQSPSSHDGAVLSCGATPTIIADENAIGLGGAELDALSLASSADEIPVFTMLPTSAAPGGVLSIEAHGDPNAVFVALMAGNTGWVNFASRPGFGAWYLDPNDPWLQSVLNQPATYARLDSQGVFRTSWPLPTGNVYGTGFGGELGWSFQILELPSFELSAPYRVTKL